MAAMFNPNTTERTPRELVPNGRYTMQASKVEQHWNDRGGFMLKAEFEILDGEHAGRKVFENFNVVNANETAQKIGREQLANLCDALDISKEFTDEIDLEEVSPDWIESMFCFKAFVAKVGVQKSKDPQYSDRNSVGDYKSVSAAPQQQTPPARPQATPGARPGASTAPAARPQTTANRPPPTGGSKPWERKAS